MAFISTLDVANVLAQNVIEDTELQAGISQDPHNIKEIFDIARAKLIASNMASTQPLNDTEIEEALTVLSDYIAQEIANTNSTLATIKKSRQATYSQLAVQNEFLQHLKEYADTYPIEVLIVGICRARLQIYSDLLQIKGQGLAAQHSSLNAHSQLTTQLSGRLPTDGKMVPSITIAHSHVERIALHGSALTSGFKLEKFMETSLSAPHQSQIELATPDYARLNGAAMGYTEELSRKLQEDNTSSTHAFNQHNHTLEILSSLLKTLAEIKREVIRSTGQR